MMTTTARREGFSLVEVMVALVILTIVVAGLAGTTVTFQHRDVDRSASSTSPGGR